MHMRLLIDDWMPTYDENELHSKQIAATPAAVERAIRALKPADLPLTRILMGLRTLPALLTGRRRPRGLSLPLLEGVQALGFVILEERAGEQIVLGAAGRFWQPRGDGVDSLDGPEAFRGYDRPGSVRAAWDFVLTPVAGGTRLSTETRIAGTDRDGTRTFRRYWRLVHPGSALIRIDMLRAVARAAAGA
jgi:hypothetical protein